RLAEIEEETLVVIELVEPIALRQFAPPVLWREATFPPRLGEHLEEEQERQLSYILIVRDAVVPQDVAEGPEVGKNIDVGMVQVPSFSNISWLMFRRIVSTPPPNTLLRRAKPPSA